jgi:uncharacterized protein (TIGR02266 family)
MTTILLGKECSTFLEIDDSLLQRADVRIAWAETTDAFVPLAREHRPAVVVLDPQIPGFDAFAAARALLAERPDGDLHVFVIGNTADAERAKAAGVAGVITRPLTQARLLEILRRQGLTPERDDSRVEVAIKVDVVHEGRDGLAYTRDLALEGCFLHTHDRFAAGDRLRLTFQLPVPGGRELKVDGVVIRLESAGSGGAGPVGIAVRFEGLAGADRGELGRFLRSRRRGVA